MSSNQIIILNCVTEPDSSFYATGVYWLQTVSNAIIPNPSFVSRVPNISVSDLSNLRAGVLTEVNFNTGSFPAGTSLATVQSFLVSDYNVQQASLNSSNPPLNLILDGYNGTTWGIYNSIQNVASNLLAFGALGALNATVEIAMALSQSVGVQISAGTFIGVIVCETSFDNVIWNQTYFSQVGSGNKNGSLVYGSANTAGAFTIVMNGGVNYARVRAFSYTSGSCNIILTGSEIHDETLDLFIATPGTTNPPSLSIIGAYVNSATPSYTSGLSNALSLTTAGALRIDASATTQPSNITQVGGVGVVAVSKGTQAANALGVQDFKDAGRVSFVAVASAVTGVTVEALITLTPIRTVTAGVAATSLTITAGKTLRLQTLILSVRNTSTVQSSAIIRVRMLAGTVLVGSQSFFSVACTAGDALTGGTGSATINFPDGFEINGTTQIGISQLCSATTCTLDISAIGFEY